MRTLHTITAVYTHARACAHILCLHVHTSSYVGLKVNIANCYIVDDWGALWHGLAAEQPAAAGLVSAGVAWAQAEGFLNIYQAPQGGTTVSYRLCYCVSTLPMQGMAPSLIWAWSCPHYGDH